MTGKQCGTNKYCSMESVKNMLGGRRSPKYWLFVKRLKRRSTRSIEFYPKKGVESSIVESVCHQLESIALSSTRNFTGLRSVELRKTKISLQFKYFLQIVLAREYLGKNGLTNKTVVPIFDIFSLFDVFAFLLHSTGNQIRHTNIISKTILIWL